MLEACATLNASRPFMLQLGIPWRICTRHTQFMLQKWEVTRTAVADSHRLRDTERTQGKCEQSKCGDEPLALLTV
jgi:hypothetical protein